MIADMPQRPLILLAESIAPVCRAWLSERADVIDAELPGDARLARAQGLVVRTYTSVDQALLSKAPELRVIGRAGVGLDNFDLAACADAGVRVVHTPDANSDAVCELVWGMILDAIRPRVYVDEALDEGAWKALRASLVGTRQLAGMTLGVYGLGRAGRRVARVGCAFGMHVIYHDLLEIPENERQGACPVSREELLERSDILTMHVDGRAENRHLIDSAALARCKGDGIFVNASRGFVVDGAALAGHLRAHPGAVACLDVVDPEPPEAGDPVLGLSNVRLTPHLGAATVKAHENMSWVVRDVWQVLQGESPQHEAFAPVGVS